jgi:hypothetical protein
VINNDFFLNVNIKVCDLVTLNETDILFHSSHNLNVRFFTIITRLHKAILIANQHISKLSEKVALHYEVTGFPHGVLAILHSSMVFIFVLFRHKYCNDTAMHETEIVYVNKTNHKYRHYFYIIKMCVTEQQVLG